MTGYWPKSRSINSQKGTRLIFSILTEQTWSIKYLLYDFLAGYSEKSEHLAPSGSQSQRAIWVILPARGASHIITATYKVPTPSLSVPSPVYRPIFYRRIHPVIRSVPPLPKKIYKPSSSFHCSEFILLQCFKTKLPVNLKYLGIS